MLQSCSFLLTISFYVKAIYSQQCNDDCQCTPQDYPNQTFDLSKLANKKYSAPDSANTALSYTFSICSNLTDECESTEPVYGCAQLFTSDNKDENVAGTSCTDVLGVWKSSVANVKLINETDKGEGFFIYFSDAAEGALCYTERAFKYYYGTQYYFYCDPKEEAKVFPARQNQVNKCLYEMEIHTKYACIGHVPSPGGSSTKSSFSFGYIAIILFFSFIIMGLVIYYIFLGIKSKNWGKESLLPPLNLCKYFWIYTCVGCKISYEFAQKKIRKKGGNDANDGLINDDIIDTDE